MPPANIQKLSQRDLICPPLSIGKFAQERHRGIPLTLESIVKGGGERSQNLKDILCALAAVGGLEPLTSIRPSVTDIVTVYDRTVEVSVATLGTDGVTVIPGEAKLVEICAGQQSLVIEQLRVLPANLTATNSGVAIFKRLAVMGFSDGFCPPGEPGDGNQEGTFQNVEHIILCPEAGFDVWAQNFDLFSKALFTIHGRMWSTC
jgi:hypothetical protein